MNNKTFTLLLIVLGLNTMRYGTYLLEESKSSYYMLFFVLNFLAFVYVIVARMKAKSVDAD